MGKSSVKESSPCKKERWRIVLALGACCLVSLSVSANVSTFAGRTGLKNEYTFGALLDSKLYAPGQLLVDNDDNIWASTNKGISKLNPETGKIENLNGTEESVC